MCTPTQSGVPEPSQRVLKRGRHRAPSVDRAGVKFALSGAVWVSPAATRPSAGTIVLANWSEPNARGLPDPAIAYRETGIACVIQIGIAPDYAVGVSVPVDGNLAQLLRRLAKRVQTMQRMRCAPSNIPSVSGGGPRADRAARHRDCVYAARAPRGQQLGFLSSHPQAVRAQFPLVKLSHNALLSPRHVGCARKTPPPAARTRARHRRDAGVHAGRHLRHGEGDGAARARGARRADRPRQHLPPVAAARARGDRRARRAASLHGLAAPAPHRLRRLPGVQPRPACARSTRTA